MAKNKTKARPASVSEHLEKKAAGAQLADCKVLVRLFKAVTGKAPKMWGPSIVGFGSYHYVYPSGREGDAPLIGFAVRGKELVLYLGPAVEDKKALAKLGRHKAGAGCVYIRSLAETDGAVLENLANTCVAELGRRYPADARN